MNDFISSANLQFIQCKNYTIKNDSQTNALESLENAIDKDFKQIPITSSQRFNIIYCYSLMRGSFEYPNGKSNVLYIGRTIGEKKSKSNVISLGFRFKHCKAGKDSKSNLCLSYYYESGKSLLLEIYEVPLTINIEDAEKQLRKEFLNKYKSFPIADGASNEI